MPMSIADVVAAIDPSKTCLFLGAGASISSGAPLTKNLSNRLASILKVDPEGLSFEEVCSLYEIEKGRKELVEKIREFILPVKPTGSILNIPNYDWKCIYTTNYDTIIEQAYEIKSKPIKIISSNFDFSRNDQTNVVKLFKIHGSIEKDRSIDSQSSMVLTTEDNDSPDNYRESIYSRFYNNLTDSDVIIMGYSLSDNDIKKIIKETNIRKRASYNSYKVYLLMYTRDDNRAKLYEKNGIIVSFCTIDDFFREISVRKFSSDDKVIEINGDFILKNKINSTSLYVKHSISLDNYNFSSMYSGSPAKYSDIIKGYTFQRDSVEDIVEKIKNGFQKIIILGASGVGKTTISRQVAVNLNNIGYYGWEHQNDKYFYSDEWIEFAKDYRSSDNKFFLVIDNAHNNLPQICEFCDSLYNEKISNFILILISSKNHWNSRIKTKNIFVNCQKYEISKISNNEIEKLLFLIKSIRDVRNLVDSNFVGFSDNEKRRRLREKCKKDFFVCMKNIFSSNSFDNIILSEFASLEENLREVYKYVCALESLGVKVHRQLITRLLNIESNHINSILTNLEDLVTEDLYEQKDGTYTWSGRHSVISDIITKYKFYEEDDIFNLLEDIVSNINPSFDIEIQTIRSICSTESGIKRIKDIRKQNTLYRNLVSNAPSEKLPRHRLINNLIKMGDFSNAETEITMYEKDIKADLTMKLYRIILEVHRSKSHDILEEDSLTILKNSYHKMQNIIKSYDINVRIVQIYCDICIEIFKITRQIIYIDEAKNLIINAEQETGDPYFSHIRYSFDRRTQKISDEYIETIESINEEILD